MDWRTCLGTWIGMAVITKTRKYGDLSVCVGGGMREQASGGSPRGGTGFPGAGCKIYRKAEQ